MANHTQESNISLTGDDEEGEWEDCTLFYFIAWGVVVGTMCIYGFAANSLSLIAFQRDKRMPATTLVQCLAVSDFMLLLAVFITDCIPYICDYTGTCSNPWYTWPYIRYIWILTPISHMCSIWFVVLIALNRYWAVCRATDMNRIWTNERSYLYICIVIFSVISFNLPRFFEYEMTYTQIDNSTWAVREQKTDFGSTKSYVTVYKSWLVVIFLLLIPITVLVVFTACTLYTLKKSSVRIKAATSDKNSKKSARARAQLEITIVLITVVIVTIICQTPLGVFHFVRLSHQLHCGEIAFYLNNVSKMLVNVNSSINFLLYYVASRKFRKLLLSVIKCTPVENLTSGASEASEDGKKKHGVKNGGKAAAVAVGHK